jgi:hypothetical protein
MCVFRNPISSRNRISFGYQQIFCCFSARLPQKKSAALCNPCMFLEIRFLQEIGFLSDTNKFSVVLAPDSKIRGIMQCVFLEIRFLQEIGFLSAFQIQVWPHIAHQTLVAGVQTLVWQDS